MACRIGATPLLLGDEEMIKLLNSSENTYFDGSADEFDMFTCPKRLKPEGWYQLQSISQQLKNILEEDMNALYHIGLAWASKEETQDRCCLTELFHQNLQSVGTTSIEPNEFDKCCNAERLLDSVRSPNEVMIRGKGYEIRR
jgi:hypothetical protein